MPISICIDATPTLQQLTQLDVPEKGISIRIMDTIGCDYFILGMHLLNDEDGVIVRTIEHDRKLTADILVEIFRRWIRGYQMKRSGNKTNTWEKLVEYLQYAKLMALADEIESILRFCSEKTMDNIECACGYGDCKDEAQVQGYGECKYEAPTELLQYLFLSLTTVIISIGAAACTTAKCHCRSKFNVLLYASYSCMEA